MNGSAPAEWSVGQSYSEGTTFQQYDFYAQMAAGSPFSDAWNWVSSEAKNVYSSVYSLVTGNVSAVPLGYFTTLAQTAPNIMPGVRFSVPSGLDHDVLALLSGSQWTSGTITYSLPDSRWDYEVLNPSANGYRSLNFNAQQAVRYALEGYSPYAGGPTKMSLSSVEGLTNLSLVYSGTDSGTLQISGFTPGAVINRSHSYYPGVPVYHGDVWLEKTSADAPGSASYMIVLHELGHSLGLKHPHDYGGTLPTMSSAHDSPEYTVMSYGDMIDYPQTYMQYDIAALQELYGADFTTNSGNTVYKWSTSGETFVNGVGQGVTAGNKIFLTIWDGGGTDTYDLSNYSSNAEIDLAPGGFVRFSPNQLALKSANINVNGNVYNAFQYHGDPRSLIENAIGGNGHDIIKGNAANNVLTGNGGNDTLTGYAGNDTLNGGDGNDSLLGGGGNDWIDGGDGSDIIYGGAGADHLDGGAGRNTLSYFDAQGGVTVKLWANSAAGDIAQGDVISHFQDVSGGTGGDWLEGDNNDNVLDGCGGGDLLLGFGGNDLLLGREGNDTLIADWGTDILEGGSGNDLFAIWATIDHAIINDFAHGQDHIQLATNLFADFAAIKAAAVQHGADVVITGAHLDITLKNVQLATLTASDFQFV
ncbi:M10 family metallopeptidase C-terminal domain-containing protein [Microvirga puerhi]|uniref:M10 family metallopeptidase C-terminal domain-containing protein n=1 Tax=Microvirga puerhi TaxID=2876078 RepID=A0ABS7VIS3_9HYPH|nr:M10 family metallopeptidase C-terminal domain-containing protein [Microvirga puerhi]MBZ6074932.1 M10 family metallopeptidase C-terminal domain-containing protein [Microvirga puerhi]